MELKKKYLDMSEIHLQSVPGDYERIKKLLKDKVKDISRIKDKGYKIVVYTKKPSDIIDTVLSYIEKIDENIVDMEIRKTSLKQIFEKIAR